MERTLILFKPDALQRQLVGEILARFETKGLKIIGMKMLRLSRELAEGMYGVHKGKDFYQPLVEFVTAGPVIVLVLEGLDVVAVTRKLIGPTFGPEAPPGSIRGDFGSSRRYNLLHGSDSPESARREIELLFGPEELIDYERTISSWIYAKHLGEFI